MSDFEVKVANIVAADEKLKKEHGISGYLQMMIAGVTIKDGIAYVPRERYFECIAWKESLISGGSGNRNEKPKPKSELTPAERLTRARRRLYMVPILASREMWEARKAECDRCEDAERSSQGGKEITRCKACGCGGSEVTRKMGVIEVPPFGSDQQHVKNFSSESPTGCFKKKWATLSFKNIQEEDKPKLPDVLEFHLPALGLGDAVCGAYAACGLAEATGRPVVMYHNAHKWLLPVAHPLVTFKPVENPNRMVSALPDYGASMHHPISRKQHFCDMLAKGFGIPKFKPKAPPLKKE